MSNITELTKHILYCNLNSVTGFKQLEISAHVITLNKISAFPIRELKLQNEKEMFTLFLQKQANTQEYAKLDVLEATYQLTALRHKHFNKLHITVTQPELLEDN